MSTDSDLWLMQARRLRTEDEWRTWEFLRPLTKFIDEATVGDRQFLLLTAASVRRLVGSPYLGDSAWVIDALEQQADGQPFMPWAAALRHVREHCTSVLGGMYWQMTIDYEVEPVSAPARIVWDTVWAAVIAGGRQVRLAAGLPDDRPEHEHRAAEERTMCDLVRCLFGNPFRPIQRELSWLTTDVLTLAEGIYRDHAFERLPILADALQDAGCADDEWLRHCMAPTLHARGCWVLDSILGKK